MGELKFRTNGGLVRTTGGGVGFSCKARHEGDIYVGGTFTASTVITTPRIAMLFASGSQDTSFNSGGAGPSDRVQSIALQSDGKILIGGQFTTYNGTSVGRICRLNSDGSLDTGFNSGGAGANNNVNLIFVQTDGKILIAGFFTTYNGTSVGRICRLNSDGSLDTGFNSGGAGANNTVSSIALQSDGKILIGGSFTTYNGTATGNVCRLNSNGSLDTNFNSGGSGATGFVGDIVVQSDGKILLVFGTSSSFSFSSSYNGTSLGQICRLNSDGTLDTNFNSGGTGAHAYSAITRIVLQSDGKIIICIGSNYTHLFGGPQYNGTSVGRICRLNSDGSLDTGFNSGGAGPSDRVQSIALQSDGKILIVGSFTTYNGTSVGRICRLNSDGSLDTGFNSGGAGANSIVYSIAAQSDGKILIGGFFIMYNATPLTHCIKISAKFLSIITSFNSGGAGTNTSVRSFALQSDGKILVVGDFTTYNETSVGRICRLNSDGSLDTGFNSGGASANSAVYSIAAQSDGKILIGGILTTYNGTSVGRICRLNSDGSLDTGFNSGGARANNNLTSIAVQSDGKILIGGTFTTYNGTSVGRICRLNSDGSLDTGFNSGGAGANNNVNCTVVQTDGKILIAGFFTTYNGTSVGRICRLNSDGSLDTGFNSGGAGANNSININSLAVQSDGKILIGGSFTTYNGTSAVRICRLNSDGSLDTGFNSGGAGPSDQVQSIALQSDGKILIGGSFTTYNGISKLYFAKLNSDGTVFSDRNDIGAGFDSSVLSILIA